MIKTKSDSIWSLAKKAKERLKNNDYDRETRVSVINNATSFASYIYKKKTENLEVKEVKRPTQTSYDEKLYKRVCEIIENDNTQNPILFLIDKELFSSLDVEAKQFYINNLTQKYKMMRTKYYKEHAYAY